MGRSTIAMVLACVAFGCEMCGSDAVARLDETHGTVERDRSGRERQWTGAGAGDALASGDGLRTAAESTAAVSLTAGGQLDVRPDTVVRFGPGADGEDLTLSLETGEVILEGGVNGLVAGSFLGSLVLEGGSRVRLNAGEGAEVLLGVLDLRRPDGETTSHGVGDTLDEGDQTPAVAAEPVAILDSPTGEPGAWRVADPTAVRVRRPGAPWTALGEAGSVPEGASLTTGAQGSLQLRGAGTIEVGSAARLAIESDTRIQSMAGPFAVRPADEPLTLSHPQGDLVVEPGATLRFDATTGQGEVVAGPVFVERDGSREPLGGEFSLGEPPAEEGGGRVPTGDIPARWSFEVQPGRTVTVHAPSVPTRLAMRVADCEGGAVEVGRARARRRYPVTGGIAPMALRAGRHGYAVECPAQDRREGTLRVMRDSGTAPLPASPPSTRVQLDGRRYTVLYQNRLPEFEVRWPDAGGPATLTVDGEGRGTGAGRWDLPAGSLGEGLHVLAARAGARNAPETRVLVRFDNVAPKIALREPANESFASGERVAVEGVLLQGWEAFIGGQPVAASRTGRFSATHRVRTDHDGFVVELRHPRHGVHYYVREAR